MPSVRAILEQYTPADLKVDDELAQYIEMVLEDEEPCWDDVFDIIQPWCLPESTTNALDDLQNAHATMMQHKRDEQRWMAELHALQQQNQGPTFGITSEQKVLEPIIRQPILDDQTKKQILKSYSLQPVPEGPAKAISTHHIHYLNQDPNKNTKKRYYNNQVVTDTGAKYVDLLAKQKKPPINESR